MGRINFVPSCYRLVSIIVGYHFFLGEVSDKFLFCAVQYLWCILNVKFLTGYSESVAREMNFLFKYACLMRRCILIQTLKLL